MIGEKLKKLFNQPTANIITPASDVAVLRENDTLLHAIIVLSNRGYQTIPVLDDKDRVRGYGSNCPNFI